MSSVLASLLAVALLIGFARPRWWLAIFPAVLAIGLTVYRLVATHRAANTDAVAFMGIVLFALALVAALLAGALIRAGIDRNQDRPEGTRAALSAARGMGMIGAAFLVTVVVIARFSSEMTALLAFAAVCVVLARAWQARLKGGRRVRGFSVPSRSVVFRRRAVARLNATRMTQLNTTRVNADRPVRPGRASSASRQGPTRRARTGARRAPGRD